MEGLHRPLKRKYKEGRKLKAKRIDVMDDSYVGFTR